MTEFRRRTPRDDAPPLDPRVWEEDCFFLSAVTRKARQMSVGDRYERGTLAGVDGRGALSLDALSRQHVLPPQPSLLWRLWRAFVSFVLRSILSLFVSSTAAATTGQHQTGATGPGGAVPPALLQQRISRLTNEELQEEFEKAVNIGDGECASACVKEAKTRGLKLRRERTSGRNTDSITHNGSHYQQQSAAHHHHQSQGFRAQGRSTSVMTNEGGYPQASQQLGSRGVGAPTGGGVMGSTAAMMSSGTGPAGMAPSTATGSYFPGQGMSNTFQQQPAGYTSSGYPAGGSVGGGGPAGGASGGHGLGGPQQSHDHHYAGAAFATTGGAGTRQHTVFSP